MNASKIAFTILARCMRSVIADVDRAFDKILNEKLIELAANNGVELAPNETLVAAAMDAAVKSGVTTREEVRMTALEAINRVITRNPSEGGFKELAKDYARNTVLVSIVLDLKAKGHKLDEVKKDSRVLELCEHFNIRPSTVEKYYEGKVKPNREIDDLSMIGLRNTKQRAAIFEEFKKEKGATFKSFWYTVIKNECRNIVAEWKTEKNKAVSEAMKIVPENDSDVDPGRVHHEVHESELSDNKPNVAESKMMAKKLKEELKKANPDYIKVLKMMNDDHLDITHRSSYKFFMKALGITDEAAFLRFQKAFFTDLKRAFQSLDVQHDEAQELLKYAKIKKLMAAAGAIYGKFLLRSSR